MKRRSLRAQGALVVLLGLAVTSAACGGQTEAAAPVREAASSSDTQPVGVKNELKNLWGGEGVEVTWSATAPGSFRTLNYPEAPSPKGFAGVQQLSPSSIYRVDMTPALQDGKRTIFTLTPTVMFDGTGIEMTPIQVGFAANYYQRDGDPLTQIMRNVQWRLLDRSGALMPCGSELIHRLDTPKNTVWYRVVAECDSSVYQGTTFVLKWA